MPTIIRAVKDKTGKRGISVEHTNPESRTGRWAKAPQIPDLCYSCFGEGLNHYPAQGYREDPEGWRHGVCKKPECRAAKDTGLGRLVWLSVSGRGACRG